MSVKREGITKVYKEFDSDPLEVPSMISDRLHSIVRSLIISRNT